MANTERDPVCGMDIDPASAAGQSDFNGKQFFFCSTECKQKFDENPQQFAGNRERPATA